MTIIPQGEEPAVDRDSVARDWLSGYHLATTKRAYERDIDTFFAWCDKEGVPVLKARRKDLNRYVGHLHKRPNATSCRMLASVSSFYSYAMREHEDVVTRHPLERITRPPVSGVSLTPFLDADELRRLLRAADASAQDAALVRLLAYTGARVGETCRASTSDLRVVLGSHKLKVTRKGGKDALLPVPPEAMRALRRHLDGRTGPLFLNSRDERMTPHQVAYRVKVLAEKAGLGDRQLTPHGLRHTAATLAMLECRDLRAVQEMLGHRQIATTSRYVHATGAPAGHVLAKSIEEMVDA